MKFKYVSWLLPLIIMWSGFYLIKDYHLHQHWWAFPYIFTGTILCIGAIGIVAYTIAEDK